MLKGLSYSVKNRLLVASAVLLALLSWNLAFRKTYDAIIQHRELTSKIALRNDISVNPHFLNQKSRVLDRIVKQYTLDSAEWKNSFWLKVSNVAALRNVSINYNPSANKPMSDSSSLIAKQEIAFAGDFRTLLSLLDSLEKMKEAGLVSSSKFYMEKKMNTAAKEKLFLKSTLGMIEGVQ